MSCFCTRCGEELTAPKFHDGKPYGFSCYEVVTGKKSKDKRKFVQVEPVEPLPEAKAFPLRVKHLGKVFYLGGTFRDTENKLHNSLAEFTDTGSVFMVTHDRKGSPIWKSIP